MVFRTAFLACAIAATSVGPQDKPNVSAVPFAQIVECVAAANCKNMTPAKMSQWSDAVGFTGLVFDDSGWKYELFLTGPRNKARDVSIMLSAPGEQSASQLLTLDSTGELVSAELRAEPSGAFRTQMTAEQLADRQQARRAFVSASRWPRSGTLGEEFKPFWQKQVDQALAAIRRQVSK